MNLLHISDLHKLNDYQGKGGIYNSVISRMSDPFEQLNKIMLNNDRKPDLVTVSGDICEFGDFSDYLSVRKKLEEQFNCPILTCSGNHDNKENLIRAFDKKKVYGELFEDIDLKKIRVILFDSSDERYNDGYISEKTCDLLEEHLKNTDKPTFIVTHHHLLTGQFTMPSAVYPDRFKKIISDSKITAVLTGHTHHIYHGSFCGKPYHTSGSLSFVAEEKNNRLFFYEHPSAIMFSLNGSELSYKDIEIKNEEKILDSWDL